ncbi:hypothetical protein DCS_08244 [Drechmeria coniospora]|uniref:Uncharacterized protein n=1 Tax=Drechmeria coniospora TaxID=98403 RepID=A0A151GGR3_DRECN|nr:hypothetical protein DCS_08244 [Drechmeria coniospora]KYK56274.1 hypothetical protein DCS_08244 [Drechmeria coniospora]
MYAEVFNTVAKIKSSEGIEAPVPSPRWTRLYNSLVSYVVDDVRNRDVLNKKEFDKKAREYLDVLDAFNKDPTVPLSVFNTDMKLIDKSLYDNLRHFVDVTLENLVRELANRASKMPRYFASRNHVFVKDAINVYRKNLFSALDDIALGKEQGTTVFREQLQRLVRDTHHLRQEAKEVMLQNDREVYQFAHKVVDKALLDVAHAPNESRTEVVKTRAVLSQVINDVLPASLGKDYPTYVSNKFGVHSLRVPFAFIPPRDILQGKSFSPKEGILTDYLPKQPVSLKQPVSPETVISPGSGRVVFGAELPKFPKQPGILRFLASTLVGNVVIIDESGQSPTEKVALASFKEVLKEAGIQVQHITISDDASMLRDNIKTATKDFYYNGNTLITSSRHDSLEEIDYFISAMEIAVQSLNGEKLEIETPWWKKQYHKLSAERLDILSYFRLKKSKDSFQGITSSAGGKLLDSAKSLLGFGRKKQGNSSGGIGSIEANGALQSIESAHAIEHLGAHEGEGGNHNSGMSSKQRSKGGKGGRG